MFWFGKKKTEAKERSTSNSLFGAALNTEHKIKTIVQDDKDIAYFLNTLGCFPEESITIVSVLSDTYVILVKDARYSIDSDLAKTIIIY